LFPFTFDLSLKGFRSLQHICLRGVQKYKFSFDFQRVLVFLLSIISTIKNGLTFALITINQKKHTMKLLFAFSLILITACNSQKEMAHNIQNLHDIWALKSVNGEDLDLKSFTGIQRQPVLEIFVEDRRIGGNDGCNSLFGSITELNNDIIRFGKLGGTKMACPNMEFSSNYTRALSNVTSFKIENLHLYLYDSEGNELLKFIKVD
tara:strand:+ start:13186 stop:13803 length:618 start_codon:yes stop_codon:yes gene_type:complete